MFNMMGIEKQCSAFSTNNFFMLILDFSLCVYFITYFHLFLVKCLKQNCSLTCISKVKGCLLLLNCYLLFPLEFKGTM